MELLLSPRRLRVLYLTHHAPWPTTSGGRVRDAALVPHLAGYTDLEVWAVSRTFDEDRAALARAAPAVIIHVFPDEASRRRFPTRDSTLARRMLRERTASDRSFDVIHVEGHYLFHLVPEEFASRTIVVEHNVESHLLAQRAAHEQFAPDLSEELAVVINTEDYVWTHAAQVLTLSDEDRQRILLRTSDASVQTCTNGADHIALRKPPSVDDDYRVATAPKIGFLANHAYPPNRDATLWLLDEIYPQIHERIPGAELVLGGSHLHDVIDKRKLSSPVTLLGWVDDVETLWDTVDIVICPLRIGGGVKVKMIEAIRGGCLIVSTLVGLEGLPAVARSAVVRADDADGFVDAILRLCKDSGMRRQYRARIVRAQRALPTWSDVARQLYRNWINVSESRLGGGTFLSKQGRRQNHGRRF